MRAGVPFGKVARALGTNEQVVEQVYGHHLPEHLRGVVETVSRGGRAEGRQELHQKATQDHAHKCRMTTLITA